MCVWCVMDMAAMIELATQGEAYPDPLRVEEMKGKILEGAQEMEAAVRPILDTLSPGFFRDMDDPMRVLARYPAENLMYLTNPGKWVNDYQNACIFRESQRDALQGRDDTVMTMRRAFYGSFLRASSGGRMHMN